MSEDALPEGLDVVARVFAANRNHRAERATAAFKLLRPYERRIVREAAVMGYVLGRQDGLFKGRRGDSILDAGDDFPKDFAVLQNVLEHCDSTSDLYPFLGDACDGRRRRVTRQRMWPGEEGWTQ